METTMKLPPHDTPPPLDLDDIRKRNAAAHESAHFWVPVPEPPPQASATLTNASKATRVVIVPSSFPIRLKGYHRQEAKGSALAPMAQVRRSVRAGSFIHGATLDPDDQVAAEGAVLARRAAGDLVTPHATPHRVAYGVTGSPHRIFPNLVMIATGCAGDQIAARPVCRGIVPKSPRKTLIRR